MPTIPSSALPDDDGRERLAELGGLTPDPLREAVHRGYTHAAGCTSNDPVIMPGVTIWGKGTGALRDIHKPKGWMAKRTENLELTLSPDKRVAIVLAAGTSGVGLRDHIAPRTRTPKGPATGRAIQQNEQLHFAGDPAFDEEDGKWQTWLLLHFYDKETGEIRMELSCPAEMLGKQVTAWRERILLQAMPFETDVDLDITDDPDDDIDVDVTRRAN